MEYEDSNSSQEIIDNKEIKFKKWINTDSNENHISQINIEISSSTDKESNEEKENIKETKKNKINNEENEDDNSSKDTKDDSKNIKINYLFIWNEGGNQVKITGSFFDWKIKFDMSKDPKDNIFKCQIPLDNKIYEFKFVVDDEWKCSNKYPIKEDNSGNMNNILDLTNYNEKKEEHKKNKSEKKVTKVEKENNKEIKKENEINKNKIKKVESIYSSHYPSNENIIPIPIPNKRYYRSFKLEQFSNQNHIGKKEFYEYYQRFFCSFESSSKPIFILGHNNLNHLITYKSKKMMNLKNCMSFRFREKACTFIYYK